MNPEPDEYGLALRAREGDPEALAELVARTRLRLFSLAYAELRHYDDAHDAVASALLQICRHIKELREPERVRAWMQSIVRNEARRLRRGPGAATMSLEEAQGCGDEAAPSLLRLDIERALRQLPSDQARASRLFYLADLSIAEIAQRTGRPEGTIKSWLHRGRQRLALEMEDYAPMTPTPAPEPAPMAAIIHTDLKPALLRKITAALRSGGYRAKAISVGDASLLLETLKAYQAIILDEWIGGRSAFEFVMHLRSHPETRETPVGVLAADPSDFTVSAYFTAGVNRVVNKNRPESVSSLAQPIERPKPNLWARFTERARRVIYFAQEEAARLGEYHVGTDHLLLGLAHVDDSAGANVLARLGISLESVREAVLRQVIRGQGTLGRDMQLTARAQQVIDLAYEEARRLNNNYIGVEHLLLGLIREAESRAQGDQSGVMAVQGVLEIVPEGWGFLRQPEEPAASPTDVYVSQTQIQRFRLMRGDRVSGQARPPREGEKYYGLLRVEAVNQKETETERDGSDGGGAVLIRLGAGLERVRREVEAIQGG